MLRKIAATAKKHATKLTSLRAPVTINAAAGESGGPPSFEAVAYSGGPIPGYTATPRLDSDYIIDLSGMTASRNPIVNLDHNAKQRVGHIPTVENDKKELRVSGFLSAATAHQKEVTESAVNGLPWEVSMEGDLTNIRKVAAGKTETVNGRTINGPMYIVRKSTFTGLAFVSNGADEGNSVSIAATAAGEKSMSEFDTFVASCGADPETITDEQRGNLQVAFDARVAAGKKPTDASSIGAGAAAIRAENTRQETIKRMTLTAMKEHPLLIDQIEQFGQKAIDEKYDPEKYELELLRSTRMQAGTFRITARAEPDSRVMEAALCMAAGLPNIEKHFSEQVLDAVDKSGMRHFGLQQILIQTASRNGYSCRAGEQVTQGNIREILEYAFPPRGPARIAATQFSTNTLPNILSGVANREILAGFGEEDMSWKEISAVKSVPDFKAMTSYRMTDSLEYEELPKGGEIKHGTLGEESYTRQAKTYAKMLGLDRVDIINDDLGAFDDLRTRLGRGAARKFNNVFWTKFMANLATFFTTARGNYIAGSTTNLGTDGVGLGLGVAAFDKLVSSDGKRIGGDATILLVPPELKVTADKLFKAGSPDMQTVANTNAFAGLYRPVKVPWLSDSAFTGNSTTAWYLFRDPRILAAMVVSFLNGQQTPTVESTDADFNTLGILFRGFHDFGADNAEYLAGIMSKGAA